jgi:hypothetical protein
LTSITLTDLGNGQYQTILATSGLLIGSHTVTVDAQKPGYAPGQSSVTFTLVEAQLTVTSQLSENNVTQGTAVTVSATVADAMDTSITGALVTATCANLSITLTDLGSGHYQGTLETTTLPEGGHPVQVSVQMVGYPAASAAASLTVTQPAAAPGLPWMYYLGFAGVIASVSAGLLYRRRRRAPTPPVPRPPGQGSGGGGVMTQTMVTTTSPFHIGRIVGIGTGIVMLIGVFLLPYTSTTDTSSLFGFVQPLLSNLNALSSLPADAVAMTYVLIIGFLLVAIGGFVGFFPLGSGVLGVVGMAILTLAPTLITTAAPQYRSFGFGFYLMWAGAIGGLVAAFLRSRRKTSIQTTQVSPTPQPTTTPPPPPPTSRMAQPRADLPPPPPPPPPSSTAPSSRPSGARFCPVCGNNTIWIPQQQQSYCTACQAYR